MCLLLVAKNPRSAAARIANWDRENRGAAWGVCLSAPFWASLSSPSAGSALKVILECCAPETVRHRPAAAMPRHMPRAGASAA